ncbi:MAG: hypothetical protein HQL78_06645 [Magnetococcales bacterium]|nr:hypothetical protein [Magnetococcales bacterium]MBF0419830.1 hypothetical protein [Magnetococcales bacterium]
MHPLLQTLTLVTVFLGVTTAPLEAAWYTKEFSAQVKWTIPTPTEPEKIEGHVYVGDKRLRIENTTKGHTNALIFLVQEKKAWTLDLAAKNYHDGVARMAMLPKPDTDILPSDPDSPCANKEKRVTCAKTGSGTLDGVATEEWTITIDQDQQKGEIKLSIDPARHLVLKQQPDVGPVRTRTFLGDMDHQGRPTEKWKVSEEFQGQSTVLEQWVDKELRLIVRESGQAGDVLLDVSAIKIAPQPDSLFKIPDGFKLTQPVMDPHPPGGPTPGGHGQRQ